MVLFYYSKMRMMKREYSVLFPLVDIDGEWNIVFERRSKNLKAHRGEISLPGGAIEAGESSQEAAMRETSEELGIEEHDIRVVSQIAGTETLDGRSIHCYIGLLSVSDFYPSADEVEELLFVPLKNVLHRPLSEEMLQTPCGHRVKSYYCDYKENRIWGITGRLLKNFVDSFDMMRQMLMVEIPYRSEEF